MQPPDRTPDQPPEGTVTETDAVVIGAGPVGLYQVFQLGLLGISAQVIDALPHVGGQCIELYPDKPIYDIPGIAICTGRELVARMEAQIAPFKTRFHLGQEVTDLQPQEGGGFALKTSAGTEFFTRCVFIAGGVGAFMPRLVKADGLDVFLGRQLFYRFDASVPVAGQHLVVNGGDDNALLQAVQLAESAAPASSTKLGPQPAVRADAAVGAAASVTLVHRRDGFQADPALVARMRGLVVAGHLKLVIGQVTGITTSTNLHANVKAGGSVGASANAGSELGGDTSIGAGVGTDVGMLPLRLTGLVVTQPDNSTVTLATDVFFALLGLAPRLGPIADWGLDMERRQLAVDPQSYATAVPGIYAVGDINIYPGKKKLIVCGFHECVLAAYGAAQYLFPDQRLLLQYTTTSKQLQARLGVAVETAVSNA